MPLLYTVLGEVEVTSGEAIAVAAQYIFDG
jgi:hypothetical protein